MVCVALLFTKTQKINNNIPSKQSIVYAEHLKGISPKLLISNVNNILYRILNIKYNISNTLYNVYKNTYNVYSTIEKHGLLCLLFTTSP